MKNNIAASQNDTRGEKRTLEEARENHLYATNHEHPTMEENKMRRQRNTKQEIEQGGLILPKSGREKSGRNHSKTRKITGVGPPPRNTDHMERVHTRRTISKQKRQSIILTRNIGKGKYGARGEFHDWGEYMLRKYEKKRTQETITYSMRLNKINTRRKRITPNNKSRTSGESGK